jgi:hypothetical protein
MTNVNLNEPIFTMKEVAHLRLLGKVSEATIRREIESKRLSAYRVRGRIFVGATHISEYLKANELKAGEAK